MTFYESLTEYIAQNKVPSEHAPLLTSFAHSINKRTSLIYKKDILWVRDHEGKLYDEIHSFSEQLFDEKEDFIRELNQFLSALGFGEHFCSIEKFRDTSELRIKLLKLLQSGEDTETYQSRESIANRLCMSVDALNQQIPPLKNGCYILGKKVVIPKLRARRNTYDKTIHPVFMTLNMDEVFFLTVQLRRLCAGSDSNTIAKELSYDVLSQLSNYAKEYILARADGISFEQRKETYHAPYEKSLTHLLKISEVCTLEFKNENAEYTGVIRIGKGNDSYYLEETNGTKHYFSEKEYSETENSDRIVCFVNGNIRGH